jgi:hypothetical protein
MALGSALQRGWQLSARAEDHHERRNDFIEMLGFGIVLAGPGRKDRTPDVALAGSIARVEAKRLGEIIRTESDERVACVKLFEMPVRE